MTLISAVETYKFIKEETGKWYIDLPKYEGDHADLQMIAGADDMLDYVGKGNNEVELQLSEYPFGGSNILKLTEDYTKGIGGGIYFLEEYKGEALNKEMWLCGVTEWVFGKLPEVIYFKKVD